MDCRPGSDDGSVLRGLVVADRHEMNRLLRKRIGARMACLAQAAVGRPDVESHDDRHDGAVTGLVRVVHVLMHVDDVHVAHGRSVKGV